MSAQYFNADAQSSNVRVVTETPETIFDNSGSAKILTATNQASSIVDISEARAISLEFTINCGSAANVVSVFPLVCNETDTPLVTDDTWSCLPQYVDTGSAGLPSGITQLSGVDFTLAPEFGQLTVRPLELKFEAGNASTDKIRVAVSLDVAHYRWFCFLAADGSGSSPLASLKARIVRVV